MNVNGTGISEVIKAPDLVKKLISRKYAVVVRSKEIEKLQLLGGHVNGLALELQLIFLMAYLDVIKLDNLVVVLIGMRLVAAKNRLNASAELLHIEGLDHKVVRSQLKPEDLIKDLSLCSYHNNGLRGHLSYLAANLPTVLFGKHNIEKHKIGLVYLKEIDTLSAVVRDLYAIALVLKIKLEKLAYIFVIVYNKDFRIQHYVPPKLFPLSKATKGKAVFFHCFLRIL